MLLSGLPFLGDVSLMKTPSLVPEIGVVAVLSITVVFPVKEYDPTGILPLLIFDKFII